MKPELSKTQYKHINIMDDGRAMIAGTRLKVQVIAIDPVQGGLSPKEIKSSYEGLSMGQVHSALAYYWDHKEKVDSQIEEETRFVDRMRAKYEPHQRELKCKVAEWRANASDPT